MRFNGVIISNRDEFSKNFDLKTAMNKIDAVCDFFKTRVLNMTEKEKSIIGFLEGKQALPESFCFDYALQASDKYSGVREKISGEEGRELLKVVLLLELAKKDIDIDIGLIFPGFGHEKIRADEEQFHTICDISGCIGALVLEKYPDGEALSSENRMVLKTFINNSPYNDSVAEIIIEDSRIKHTILLGCGESVTGSFVNGKLAALFPPVDVGDKHIIVNDGGGKFRRISPGEEIKERRYVFSENAVFMSATNDGGVFVDGNEIEIRSNAQPYLEEVAFEDGEKCVAVFVRREKYAVLTNFGRLIYNNFRTLENIRCALMRKNGECYAISADGKLYIDGKYAENTAFDAYTNYELINFGGIKRYEDKDICELADLNSPVGGYSFFGKCDGYAVIKTASGIKIRYKNGKLFRYDK